MEEQILFVPNSFQIALFFSQEYSLKKLSIAMKISEVFQDIFSKDPSIPDIPLNTSVPADFPQILFRDENAGHLVVTNQRADLVLLCNDTVMISNIPDLALRLASCFDIHEIVRFGLVCNYKINEEISLSDIRKNFLSDEMLHNQVTGFSIGWTKSIKLSRYESTQFVNYVSSSLGNYVVVDHNTNPQEKLYLDNLQDIKNLTIEVMQYLGDGLNATIDWSSN